MFDEYTRVTSSGSPSCGKYYTSDNSWRLYQTSDASLSITSTKTIDYVIIRYLSQASGVLIYNEDNVLIGEKVYVNSKEITFIVGNALTNKTGQARITSIVIAYAGEENVTSFEVSNIPSNGIALYDTYQLEWKFSGLNGLNQELEFISGNEEVFTIDKNGLISAVGIGEAELFVSALGNPNINATYTIKVYSSNYFKIEYENEYYVNIGETISISAVYIQGGKEIADLNWESLNPEIAIVENGVVTGISEGEVIIRISYEDNYYDLSISVVDSTQVVVNYDLNGGVFSDAFYAFVDEFAEEIIALFNSTGKSDARVTTRENFQSTSHPNVKYVFSQAENLEKYKWLIQMALDAVNEGTTGDYVTETVKNNVAEMLTKMLAGDTEAINGSYADGRTAFRQFIHRLINIGGTEGDTVYNCITYDFSQVENIAKFDAGVETVVFTESAALATPRREGYIFAGWFDAEGNEVKSVTISYGSTTINVTAKWQVGHTVSFDLNGGELPKEIVGDALYTVSVNVYKNGWTDDRPQFADATIKDAGSSYIWTPKVFLVYHADVNAYEVVEKAPADGKSTIQGATSAWTHCLLYVSDAEYETIQVGQYFVADAEISVGCAPFKLSAYAGFAEAQTKFVYAEDVTELPVPTKEGFTFLGWFNGETKVESITIGTESATYTLVAKWESAPLTKLEIVNSLPLENYITNNPSYPNPAFYKDGGLKVNYINMGVITNKFEAQSAVEVTLNILALGENTKYENSTETDAFTVYGLNEAGEVVATASTNDIAVGDVKVELVGEGIVQVKVIMTDFFFNGTKCVNVNLGGVIVK